VGEVEGPHEVLVGSGAFPNRRLFDATWIKGLQSSILRGTPLLSNNLARLSGKQSLSCSRNSNLNLPPSDLECTVLFKRSQHKLNRILHSRVEKEAMSPRFQFHAVVVLKKVLYFK
jgi:hypothetical protein